MGERALLPLLRVPRSLGLSRGAEGLILRVLTHIPGGSGFAAGVSGLEFLLAALALLREEVAADAHGEEEGDDAEGGDEEGGGDIHVRSTGGAEVVTAELKVEAAARQSELARGARDVAVVLAQRLGDHAPLKLGHRVGQR